MSWLINYPFLPTLAGWMTLFFETTYCIFIWPKITRPIWVLTICSMHIGIALLLGLGVFGSIMTVMTFSLFGLSAEPGALWLELPDLKGWVKHLKFLARKRQKPLLSRY